MIAAVTLALLGVAIACSVAAAIVGYFDEGERPRRLWWVLISIAVVTGIPGVLSAAIGVAVQTTLGVTR